MDAAVHYGAFVGPACLVLVCNCIVFAFVLRVLSLSSDTKKPAVSPQTQSTKATSISSQVKYKNIHYNIIYCTLSVLIYITHVHI